MTVDNLSQLVTVLSVVGTVAWFLSNMNAALLTLTARMSQFDEQMKSVDVRLDKLSDSIEKISQIIATMARQEEQLSGLVKRFDEYVVSQTALQETTTARLAALDLKPKSAKRK